MARRKRGRSGRLLLLLPLLLSASCGEGALSLFFDVPPPSEKPAEQAAPQKPAAPVAAVRPATPSAEAAAAGGERPAIEAILNYEQAYKMLPKDDIDEVDWVAAMRDGIIKPRASIDGSVDPAIKVFGWNFYFAGPEPENDAYFPHSTHTEWLDCASCHPKLFPYRELGMSSGGEFGLSMDRIFEGEYCGTCHSVVAFPLDNCSKCHTKM